MTEIILKCGACGTTGTEKEFENEHGVQSCKWCGSDVWLDTIENHNEANE
ncbi:hypothetical protein [Sporosarcina sp. FSL W7-1283]